MISLPHSLLLHAWRNNADELAFPVLSGIESLTMLAETDDSGANARAVETCGERWSAAGREVIVATPRVVGDILDAMKAAHDNPAT